MTSNKILDDDAVLALAIALMKRASITPADDGCQDLLLEQLNTFGFEHMRLDAHDTRNFYAWRTFGDGTGPHLLFAGHTDVVPPGPLDQWHTDPFDAQIIDGFLTGRGAADMKGSLAAMLGAVSHLTHSAEAANNAQLNGTLSFLITSDEEGDATWGTQYAINELIKQEIQPDFCIVGEPSSSNAVGDVVRCGRRGSVNATLTVSGVQGHVAYPDDADNPIHKSMAVLDALASTVWDEGNDYYPPTSLQISNLESGTGANNVIPGQLQARFNLRFNTEQTVEGIQARVAEIFAPFQIDHHIDWQISGLPFLTERGRLTDAVSNSIQETMGFAPELSTSGGTSDGRFIAPWAPTTPSGTPTAGAHRVDVVELGPTNATIHKINERIPCAELSALTKIYTLCARQLLSYSNE